MSRKVLEVEVGSGVAANQEHSSRLEFGPSKKKSCNES